MKKFLPIIVIVVLAAAIESIAAYFLIFQPVSPNNVACTMEAKICPDGSAVGRSGPNCEFAQCPTTQCDGEFCLNTTSTGTMRIPNPASVNCKNKGGTVEIIYASDGSQSGICNFPDGTKCEEWALFRNECQAVTCIPEGGLTYQNVYSLTPVEKIIKCCAGLVPQKNPFIADVPEICVPQNNVDNCNQISNSEFRSINQYEGGLGPDGPGMGYWYVKFVGNKFNWAHSDVGESGTYLCENNILQVKLFDRYITAFYNGSKKIMTWDGIEYKKIK